MSRQVVGYEGEGKHRRPLYRDLGPASGSVVRTGAAAVIDRLSASTASALREVGAKAPVGGAGRVERSQATAAQREAWATAEARPRYLTEHSLARPAAGAITNAERMQASRMRGAFRHVEVAAAARPVTPEPPEEIAMPERPAEPLEEEDTTRLLRELVLAANVADDAYLVMRNALRSAEAAEIAWLKASPNIPETIPAPVPGPAEIVAILERPARSEAKLAAGGGPGLPPMQARILAATVRLRGDRKAVSAELHVPVSNIENQLELIGRKGLLPIDLIAKLPARFAKYTGV